MKLFPISNYLWICLSIVFHYSIGKRLGAPFFLTRCLAGVCFSALAAGLLANLWAGAVRPVTVAIILVAGLFSIRDALSSKISQVELKTYLYLFGFGVLIFALNEPSRVFFTEYPDGKTFLQFDDHYSGYASLSLEMLRAEYFGRLRVADFYPYTWSRYHFFNPGFQATTQTLLPFQNLFSYFQAVLLIMILIILSFGEQIFFRFSKSVTQGFLHFTLWFAVGFSIFQDSLHYEMPGNGPISVFAVLHLLFSMAKRRHGESMLFALILGASAYRQLPMGIISMSLILWVHRDAFREWRDKSSNPLLFSLLAMFISYKVITPLFSPGLEPEFGSEFFDDAAVYPLTFYKLFGYFFHRVFERLHVLHFHIYNETGFFYHIIHNRILYYSFHLIAGGTVLVFIHTWIRTLNPLRGWLTLALSVFVFGPLAFSWELFSLHLVYAPYILISYYFVFKRDRTLGTVVLGLLLACLFYQYTNIMTAIKGPVACIYLDVMLFGIIGISCLFREDRMPIRAIGVVLIACILFPPRVADFFREPANDRPASAYIDITPLLSPAFKRHEYVNSDNFLAFEGSQPLDRLAYSSILSVRQTFNPGNQPLSPFAHAIKPAP